jgi:uracil-DNA glycosylase
MAAARQQHPEAPRRSQIEPKSLGEFNAIIKSAKPLVPGATRAVLGEGPVGAQVAFVGEQPGDQEDRLGRPFVGPSGQLLDSAMADACLDRSRVYVTNAVKHFKFEQRGKRLCGHAVLRLGLGLRLSEHCGWRRSQGRMLGARQF